MSIEDDLRQALRRKPAPPDLVDRVMARIADSEPARPVVRPMGVIYRAPSRWLAAAAAVALVATGAARYYAHEQELAKAERVKQEIGIALQITSAKLALVQQRVEESVRR